MHNTMLFFTDKGRCYWLRVYEIEEGGRTAKGRAIQNMLNIEPDDRVNACLYIKDLKNADFCSTHYVVFATERGIVKKTCLTEYSRPSMNGVNAININEDDRLVSVVLTNGNDEILMANRGGRAIRFPESAIRPMGRTATGVRGMVLDGPEDAIVGMVAINDSEKETVLVVSENGFGKRSVVEDYRRTGRSAKGVKTLNITDKTGAVIAIKCVKEDEDLMIINRSGITLRLHVTDIRQCGRATQGVKLINLTKRNDAISSVCLVPADDEEETLDESLTETLSETTAETPETSENIDSEVQENVGTDEGTDVE